MHSPSAAVEFHGVGDGTVIDHLQVHASAGNGLAFRGGRAHCGHCVASDARGATVSWSHGWQGSAQFLYAHQRSRAATAMHGSAAGLVKPGTAPEVYNVTLVGGRHFDRPGSSPGARRSSGPGIMLDGEAATKARNLLATGFAGYAIDGSVASFAAGSSSVAGAILAGSGSGFGASSQVRGRFEPFVEHLSRDPDLLNVRYEANPDPRPRSGSIARRPGNAAVPPFARRFSRSAHYVGAFGRRNWLEEWTFFGPEQDYEAPVD